MDEVTATDADDHTDDMAAADDAADKSNNDKMATNEEEKMDDEEMDPASESALHSDSAMASLPAETLLHIFDQLYWSDLLECCLVCRRWFELIAFSSRLQDRFKWCFRVNKQMEKAASIIGDLANRRNHFNLWFERKMSAEPIINRQDWKLLLNKTRSLSIIDTKFSMEHVIEIVGQCHNLRGLSIESIPFDNTEAIQKLEDPEIQDILSKIEELDIRHIHPSDKSLNALTKNMMDLKKLIFAFHSRAEFFSLEGGIRKRRKLRPIMTLRNAMSLITSKASTLTALDLSDAILNKASFDTLATCQELKLKDLGIGDEYGSSDNRMIKVVLAQKELKKLHIFHVDLGKNTAIKLFQHLSQMNLQELILSEITFCFSSLKSKKSLLSHFTHLERLEAYGETEFPIDELLHGLPASDAVKNKRFRRLRLNQEMSEKTLMSILDKLKSTLMSLEVEWNMRFNAITNKSMAFINREMKLLTELDLMFCKGLSDEAFLEQSGSEKKPIEGSCREKLRRLRLGECPYLTEATYRSLPLIYPRLEELNLSKTNISDSDVMLLMKALPRLRMVKGETGVGLNDSVYENATCKLEFH